jgi:hypothetical protein
MLKPQGYGSGTGPAWRGGKTEGDMTCCIHCGHVDLVQAGIGKPLCVLVFRTDGTHYLREAGFCRSCMASTCGRAQCIPCNNRFRALEIEEKQARRFICL